MILTQNGELINPNNVERIYWVGGVIYASMISSAEYRLGEYEGEEKAKAVVYDMKGTVGYKMPDKEVVK